MATALLAVGRVMPSSLRRASILPAMKGAPNSKNTYLSNLREVFERTSGIYEKIKGKQPNGYLPLYSSSLYAS
ncbi:hypothetical protein MTBPR1_10449 [Candidatus Terasakiella magnetica]|uniref:Uncharacterized protein n=1 Tax=Candidatus Terasakiella magnetica TaxID=1867952 RepID=A0A1C3RD84_9PROT|nr:hypothetical protein MTBPR1_10449 [Candidatus Terasakiella magnetica]